MHAVVSRLRWRPKALESKPEHNDVLCKRLKRVQLTLRVLAGHYPTESSLVSKPQITCATHTRITCARKHAPKLTSSFVHSIAIQDELDINN